MIDSSDLPAVQDLKQRAKALAMLDAILCPEWEYRYYSFNDAWYDDEQLASMRNGGGDEWFLLFAPFGAAIKGFSHESEAARIKDVPSLIPEILPLTFRSFYEEPAFGMNEASFCYWNVAGEKEWGRVDGASNDEGSDSLLDILISPASRYRSYAEDYFNREIPLSSIEALYEGEPLTEDLIASLNPAARLEAVREDAKEIGYRVSDSFPNT